MRSVKDILELFLEKSPYKEKLKFSKLWVEWDKVVGEHLCSIVYPLGKKGRTLIIGVENNIVMQEVFFRKKEILKKIDEFLGFQPFDDVVIELIMGRTPLNKLKIK